MSKIDQLLEMLKSNSPDKRYDACEQLRVAPSIPEEALSALREVTQDSNTDVADAARRALAMHASFEDASISAKETNTPYISPTLIQEIPKRELFNKQVGIWIGIGILGLFIFAVLAMSATQAPKPPEAQDIPDLQTGWATPFDEEFTDLTIDPKGRILGGTRDQGIALLSSTGDIQWITLDEKLTHKQIQALAFDSKGRLWVGADDGGSVALVAMRDLDETWKIFNPDYKGDDFRVMNIVVDTQDRAWIQSFGDPRWGVIDPAHMNESTYNFSNSGLDQSVPAIAVDSTGNLWCITERYQVMTLGTDGKWEVLAILPPTDSSWGFSLAIDQQGLPWVASIDQIYHLGSDGKWSVYDDENLSFIEMLTLDHNGRLWGSHNLGNVFVLDNNANLSLYDSSNSGLKYSGPLNTIIVDNTNKIWIATGSNLITFDTEVAFSPTNILARQEAEQKHKEAEQKYQDTQKKYEEAKQKTDPIRNGLRGLAGGLILVALFGIVSCAPKATRSFLCTFPPVQAFLVYMISVTLGWFKPDLIGIGFIILIAFSIWSPIANLFAPYWWLNTGALLLSWYALVNALSSTYEAISGSSLGAGGMILIPSMLAVIVVLPVTALIKLAIYANKKKSAS